MNKRNYRKTSLKLKETYLTAKERKVLEWYESQRRKSRKKEAEN